MKNEIHVGDVGTYFKRTVTDDTTVVDVSTATLLQIIFQKPDGTRVVKTAHLVTDGTDGEAGYITVAGDLDVAGAWQLQVHVEMGGGKWSSDVESFKVFPNL